MVDELLGCSGLDSDAVEVKISLHLCHANTLVAIELDWSSSSVNTNHSERTGLLAPLVAVAKTQDDLLLYKGEGGHYLVSYLLIQRGVEEKINLLGAHEASTVDAELVGGRGVDDISVFLHSGCWVHICHDYGFEEKIFVWVGGEFDSREDEGNGRRATVEVGPPGRRAMCRVVVIIK